MVDCLFCAIAAGEIPSCKLYQDERTFAFLDINPLRRGHALVIPKLHTPKLADASKEDAAAVMLATKAVAAALADLTGDPDATIAINDGPAAGQEIAHLHVHIVPRDADDGFPPIHGLFGPPTPGDKDDLAVLAAQVRDALGVAD